MNEFKIGDVVDFKKDAAEKDVKWITKHEGVFPIVITSVSSNKKFVRFNGSKGGWDYNHFVKVCKEIPEGPTGPKGEIGLAGPIGERGLGKYDREIIGRCGTRVVVDVYRILDAYQTENPILDHLIKKALCAGLRGHKDKKQDLLDILHSAHKAVELHEQKEGK